MKKIFITGGSGTIGSSFIKKYYNEYKFVSYSRNEKMQVALKRKFPEVDIILGSVEDKMSLINAVRKTNPNIIIHAAALKHVDTAEINPMQAVKSNIIGSLNVIEASFDCNVGVTIGISTDKACSPDNNYGHTKSLMEQMFLEAFSGENKFLVCRFGNVTHSHGSVLPYWLRLREDNKPLKLTSKDMTRLMFSRESAVTLVHDLLIKAEKATEPFILSKKMQTVNLYKLALLISKDIEDIGLRPGEKLYEVLINKEELPYTYIEDDYIMIKSNRNTEKNILDKPYSSDTADEMSEKDMIDMVSETNHSLKKSLIEKAIY